MSNAAEEIPAEGDTATENVTENNAVEQEVAPEATTEPKVEKKTKATPRSKGESMLTPFIAQVQKTPATLWGFFGALGVWLLLFPRYFAGLEGFSPQYDRHYLDTSWKMALHEIWSLGLQWGSEVIFAYGPLGVLSARQHAYGMGIWYLLSDLFIFGNLAFIAALCATRVKSFWSASALVMTAFLMGWNLYTIDLSLSLLVIIQFYAIAYALTASTSAWGMASTAAILAFFIKVNSGFVGLVFLGIASLYRSIDAKSPEPLFRTVLVVPLAIGVGCLILNVDLVNYVIRSMAIAQGFNDGMFITLNGRSQYLYSAMVIFASLGLVVALALAQGIRLSFLVSVLITLGSLFVLFKQGFLRADGHELAFFQFAPAVLGVLWVWSSGAVAANLARVCLVALVFSFPSMQEHFTAEYLKGQVSGLLSYPTQIANYGGENRDLLEVPKGATLSKRALDRIEDSTIDVVPWDVATLYFNRLNYTPRPTIQSYAALDGDLDRLNAMSIVETGPDMLLFRFDCIDGRYCPAEESATKRVIGEYYERLFNDGPYAVMARRPVAYKQGTLLEVSNGIGRLGEPIEVPRDLQNKALYIEASVQYDTIGKLRSALFKPAGFQIAYTLKNGKTYRYRGVRKLLKAGIPLSPFIANLEDSIQYMGGDLTGLSQVDSFTVLPTSNLGLANEFGYRILHYKR